MVSLSCHMVSLCMAHHQRVRNVLTPLTTAPLVAASATQTFLFHLDCYPKMAFECAYCLKTYNTKRGLSNHQSRTDCIEFHNAILHREGVEPPFASNGVQGEEEQQVPVGQGDEYMTCEHINIEPDDEFPSSGPQPSQPSLPQEEAEAEPPHHPMATRPRRVKRTIHFESFPPPPPPPTELEPSADAQVGQDSATPEPSAEEVAIEEESDLDLGRPSRMSLEDQNGIVLSVTPHDQVMASLYKLCDDAGAPKYLCDDIVSLIREKTLKNNFDIFSPAMSQRRTFFRRVKRQLDIPGPEAIPVTLESSGGTVTVYRFRFLERLQRHLLSQVYSDMENLTLPDPTNVWNSMVSDPADHSSAIKSTWYKETCDMHHQQLSTGKYLLHPLTLYIDKTGADGIMKNTLEPLVCTSTILTAKARQDSSNWFVLGYIPNMEYSSTAERKMNSSRRKTRSVNFRDYHRCLAVLLEPLKKLQREQTALTFRRGGDTARYRIICPIATVLGDNLSNNKLCGMLSNYTASSVRMSRCCLTAHEDTDQVPHVCTFVDGSVVHKLCMDAMGCCHGYKKNNDGTSPALQNTGDPLSSNLQPWLNHLAGLTTAAKRKDCISLRKLREDIADSLLQNVYGSHCLDNAFVGMDFGSDSTIHQCTMADLMHSVEEGIFKHVIECILGVLSDKVKARIDKLVEQWFTAKGSNRSGERPNYPRVNFTRGFCKPTMLSADERVGQLFIISLLLHTRQGMEVLQPRFDLNFDHNRKKRKGAPEEEECDDEDNSNYEDDEEGHHEEDNARKKAEKKLKGPEKEKLLGALGLGYVTQECLPRLPLKHQRAAMSCLDALLTTRMFGKIKDGLELPGQIMSFRSTAITTGSSTRGVTPLCPATRSIPTMTKLRPRGEDLSLRLTMQQTGILVQQLLAFHAFCKYGGSLLGSGGALVQYQKSFNTMMAALKLGIKREGNTNGFKIQKFLECCHFLQDHLRHGPTAEHNSDQGERGLKHWGKKVAVTAQKRSDATFKGQVVRNVQELEILDILDNSCKMIHGDGGILGSSQKPAALKTTEETEMGCSGKNFVFQITPAGSAIYRVTDTRTGAVNREPVTLFPKQILHWLDNSFRQVLRATPGRPQTLSVQLVTEIKLFNPENKEFEIVRAHPDYRGEGCWYEYVEIDYGEEIGSFPARCALFFQWPAGLETRGVGHFDRLGGVGEGELMALVQQSQFQTRHQKSGNSLLFSNWTLEHSTSNRSSGEEGRSTAKFTCLAAASINRRVFAVDLCPRPRDGGPFFRNSFPHNPTTFEIVKVEDRQLDWPTRFLSSYRDWT